MSWLKSATLTLDTRKSYTLELLQRLQPCRHMHTFALQLLKISR